MFILYCLYSIEPLDVVEKDNYIAGINNLSYFYSKVIHVAKDQFDVNMRAKTDALNGWV